MSFALTSVCVNGQGESERDVTDKIVNVGVPRSTQRLKSGAINGRDSVSESRRAVLSLLVALCWAELTMRRPGATHADVNANCLHVGEVAQMLSHLPCEIYMSERPFLQHPLPTQHLPPIKRAIARLLPLPQVIRDLGVRCNEVDANIVLFHPPPLQHPPPIGRAIARMRRKARRDKVVA